MIWGAPGVPALGTSSLVLLGVILVLVARHAIRSGVSARRTGLLAAAVALGLAWSAWAQTGPMLPFKFTNGSVADATQVNANFTALANAVGVLQTQGQPRTRVLSIPALAFTSITAGDTRFELDSSVTIRKVPGVAGTVILNAPVYLPDGAVITQVSALVKDSSTTAGENIQIQLLASTIGSFSPNSTSVPILNSDSIQPTVNIATLSSPTVSESVQTSLRALFVQATLSGTSGNPVLNLVQIQYQY
jgi:hypothetical protein